uniref:Uncharacterized protein n=1 Tax=Avena sativa TaxID=4498 RepID=A0ACD5UVS3_AVESA
MNGVEHPGNGRTAYHFQPAKYWQNDPNGPMYHNGMYHFFYQYNPHGPTWDVGKLSWGHSVSGDLVHWAALDNALDPTDPFDANGCWSGSATVLPGGRPAILYTGIDADKVQVQNVAFAKDPSDPLLREWEKASCNPVIPIPADVTGNNFRDPTEAWRGRDGLSRVGVVAEVNGVGSLLVYRSADFLRWERNAAPLHASSRDVPVLECPDLFPVTLEPGATEGLETSANGAGLRHVLNSATWPGRTTTWWGGTTTRPTPSCRRSPSAAWTAGSGGGSTTATCTRPSPSTTRARSGACCGRGWTRPTAAAWAEAGPASRRSRGRCGWTGTGSGWCSGPWRRSRR